MGSAWYLKRYGALSHAFTGNAGLHYYRVQMNKIWAWEMVDTAKASFLSVSVLLFLFAGLYKLVVPSPVDLTIVAASLTCVALMPYWRDADGWLQPVVLIAGTLMLWTAFRLFPDATPWGIRKFAESVLFGVPAVAGGFIIARSPAVLPVFMRWLAFSTLITCPIVILGIDNVRDFQTLGNSGYQLTGFYFAAAMVAAASLKQPWQFVAASLACTITGNLSGFLFGILAVLAVWFVQRDWRSAVKLSAFAIITVVAFSALIMQPIVFGRLSVKVDRAQQFNESVVERNIEETDLPPVADAPPAITQGVESKPAPPKKADRLELFYVGLQRFLDQPLLGWGFGKADYVYDRTPHNPIIELAAETGILGGILAIALGFTAIGYALRSSSDFVIGYVILVSLTALVSGNWGARIMMFGVGLAAGAWAQHRKRA